jgi:hypothetical protein
MKLFDYIEKTIPILGGWASVIKAQTFAALVLSYRPIVSVELGAWCGRGALSLALAHKEIGRGMCYAIDAWSAEESVKGQINELDRKHWSDQRMHDEAYLAVLDQVSKLSVQNCIKVIRGKSSEVAVPEGIGFLIVDGNHGPEAIADVKRWAPKILTGGFVYLDDLDWSGGNVRLAEAQLKSMGFRDLYPIETGAMYQRS